MFVSVKDRLLASTFALRALSPAIGILQWRQRRRVLAHTIGPRAPRIAGEVVADKVPTNEDVDIARRLLAAWRTMNAAPDPSRHDLWTIIYGQVADFIRLLESGNAEALAAYLCNVSRLSAANGLVQGSRQYERIIRDPSYRSFLLLMAMDKLVLLAEALGVIEVENPEQGLYGGRLELEPNELIDRIGAALNLDDLCPPDIDGGLLKLRAGGGLFGERDLNAIYTAYLIHQLAGPGKRILEIGGGGGRVAYWSMRLRTAAFTILDLPHVNMVQGYYLIKSLGPTQVSLRGETDGTPVRLLPASDLKTLGPDRFDFVVNQDSFPEMHFETAMEYLRWIEDAGLPLISINHEGQPRYGNGQRSTTVPELMEAVGGFSRRLRFPYWLRKGYVVEVYEPRGGRGGI